MSTYRTALQAHLAIDGNTQAKLAEAAGITQAAISRYVTGDRFPDREMAQKIDIATEGGVSLAIWREEAARRLGLDAAA